MQGTLGEKIGEGEFADVHAWAPGQVLKLWKAGIPRRTVSHEARMIRTVFAAGLPAPEVFGEVTLDGRFGIVLTRLDGPTLSHLSRTGAVTLQQVGAILATLAMDLHGTPAPAAVLSLRDWMDHSMRGAGDRFPQHIAAGILSLIDRLPSSGGLCHCDLHPGNVIITADGPKLVDWIGVVRAPGALDLAVSHFLLSEIFPEHADDPERPRAIDAALQSEYARLASMSPTALTAAMEPCLPIVCGFVLLGGLRPARREQLIQRVEVALRSETGSQ
jgi:Ser/Thr protein kinase RdoA (MazF antagonist)